MKKIMLLSFLCIGLLSFSQKPPTLKLKKVERFQLKLERTKNFNIGMPPTIRIAKNYLYPSKGYVFFKGKNENGGNILIILNAESVLGKKTNLELPYESYFQVVRRNKSKAWYCSCGSKVSASEGDNCQVQTTSQGFQCVGGCSGENQGSTCSITSFDFTTGIVEQQY